MVIQSEKLIKNPKLSLVIATYNQVNFIEKTLESALSQTCSFDYEILVADDCSSDGSRDLLKRLQHQYPEHLKLLFNDTNLMVTRNYVNAIYEARGEYVATLDGDDIYLRTDVFQKFCDYLDEHNDVSLVHAGFVQYDNTTQTIIEYKSNWFSPLLNESGKQAVYDFLMDKYSFYPLGSATCFRREEYIEGCRNHSDIIDESWKFGEGTILNVSMLMTGRFGFIDEIFTQYRILKNSLSHFDDNREKYYNFLKSYLFVKVRAAISVKLDNSQVRDIFKQMEYCLFKRAAAFGMYGVYKNTTNEFSKRYSTSVWYTILLRMELQFCAFVMPLIHCAYCGREYVFSLISILSRCIKR